MPFNTAAERQKHINNGERDIKDWAECEKQAQADLQSKTATLLLAPNNHTLQKRVADAEKQLEAVSKAKQQREMAQEAAKRAWGWID